MKVSLRVRVAELLDRQSLRVGALRGQFHDKDVAIEVFHPLVFDASDQPQHLLRVGVILKKRPAEPDQFLN